MKVPNNNVLELLRLAVEPKGHPFWHLYVSLTKEDEKGFLDVIDQTDPKYDGPKNQNLPFQGRVQLESVLDPLNIGHLNFQLTVRTFGDFLGNGAEQYLTKGYDFSTAYLLGYSKEAQDVFFGINQDPNVDLIMRPKGLISNTEEISDYCQQHNLTLKTE